VALAGFGLLAGIRGEPEILRILFACSGYVFFVLLFRSALRQWRSDWTDLWETPTDRSNSRVDRAETPPLVFRVRGRRAMRFFLLFGIVAAARGQQTIFNLPNADVLERGKTYLEVDVLGRPQSPSFAAFTGRVVWGLGNHVEAGLNLGGWTVPGRSIPVATPNVKWQPSTFGSCSATAGAFGLFFLRGAGDGTPGALGYTHLACKLPTETRATAGAYWASSGYAAAGVQKGVLAGLEQRVVDGWTIAADWFSGENALGYLSPGLIVGVGPWTVYASYSLKNGDAKRNAFLFELGLTF
jgi:hypothetical protein